VGGSADEQWDLDFFGSEPSVVTVETLVKPGREDDLARRSEEQHISDPGAGREARIWPEETQRVGHLGAGLLGQFAEQ
jgi:hypothetical protein